MPDRLHFEDFTPGQIYPCGERIISEAEIVAFAREFDPQPQHVDMEEAKHSILGGLAPSGWHVCAFAMRMAVDEIFSRSTSMGSPGVEEVQWRRPVRPGDSLKLDVSILGVRPSASRSDRGYVRMTMMLTRKDEMVMKFTCTVIFSTRS